MQQIRVCTYDGPGAQPVIRNVPWPAIPKKAALIKVGACGVCGTDLHILKGHWPKPLPWPFTLGHEIGGVLVEVGSEFTEDFMSKPLKVGSKVMIPPLMPCGHCYYCIHYPESANKCLTPVYYGRYLGFDKAPHLWGGWAEYVYVDLEMLPGTKIYEFPDDMSLRLGALCEILRFVHPRLQPRRARRRIRLRRRRRDSGLRSQCESSRSRPRWKWAPGRVIFMGRRRTRGSSWRAGLARKPPSTLRKSRRRRRAWSTCATLSAVSARIVMDCSGHPSAGPEGIEMLRDSSTYVEIGHRRYQLDQYLLAPHLHEGPRHIRLSGVSPATICRFGVDMLYRTRNKYQQYVFFFLPSTSFSYICLVLLRVR